MGYSVYWMNGRWQGYGVPAFCDYPGCNKTIDRGLGYQHAEDEESGSTGPLVFCCNEHRETDLSSFEVDYEREHPEWLAHILTDESWEQWRGENPLLVEKYETKLSVSRSLYNGMVMDSVKGIKVSLETALISDGEEARAIIETCILRLGQLLKEGE